MAGHGGHKAIEAALDLGGVLAALIAENVGGPVHPVIGTLDVRPECGRALQAAADQLTQPRELRGVLPLLAVRSRLAATFSSRALSFRPEAASGALPSSVMALRTAAQ